MIGHPLGNRISLNQGKVLRRVRLGRVPLVAVRMLGAEGASGSSFVDDQGRVVGLLQLGLGSKDVLGQRTSGLVLGIDLSMWWGARARRDLCRAYPTAALLAVRAVAARPSHHHHLRLLRDSLPPSRSPVAG
jgi:hypothetical protein